MNKHEQHNNILFALKRLVFGGFARGTRGENERPVQNITRELYINSPSPIEAELHELFGVNAPHVIFDIGACEGEDSIRYAKMYSGASIFAFEPLPDNVAMIKRQLRDYGFEQQVTIFPVALSDSTGTVSFHVSSGAPYDLPNTDDWNYGNKAGSLLAPEAVCEHYPWLKFDTTIMVQTDTIENFCIANRIGSIDLIHMDVQGAELKVLLGAGPMLANIRAIWMEVERVPLYSRQPLVEEVEAFMDLHNFLKVKDTVTEITGDHLYIKQV